MMARPKGPKEWQPRGARLRGILRNLEKRTVDTSEGPVEQMRVICAADPQGDGTLHAWHVTDNPEVVKDVLRRGVDLQEMRPWGDLCGGLYVSACPDIWKARSRKKWDFIEALTPRQARALADLIVQELWEKFDRGYITQWEHERARRDVEHYWLVRGSWNVLALVAGQPWNVNIQELAREGGIADPFRPAVVEVVFTGRYLDAADGVFEESAPLAAEHFGISGAMTDREDVCRWWRAMGWDGAFTRSGMGTYAELVIWNADSIRRFGDLEG